MFAGYPCIIYALAYFGSVFPFSSANAASASSHYLSFALKCSFFLWNTYIVTFHSILLFNTLCPKICFVPCWIALRRRKGTLPWESMLANEGTANCSFRTIILTARESLVQNQFARSALSRSKGGKTYLTLLHIIRLPRSFLLFPTANRNVRWNDYTPACYVEKYRFVRARNSCLSSRVPKYPLNCRNRERRGLYDLPSWHNMSSAGDECIDHKHLFHDSDSWIVPLTDATYHQISFMPYLKFRYRDTP